MAFEKINIEQKLLANQRVTFNQVQIMEQVKNILEKDQNIRTEIDLRIKSSSYKHTNLFDIDLLDSDKIFHINSIKSICVDYRLRFLDSFLFKNTIPEEAVTKIKYLENIHNTKFDGFRIMAPAKLFKLEKADDPLLFIPIGNDYYYLAHKWGNDLNPFRKFMMLQFKSMSNIIFTILLVSVITTLVLPISKFGPENVNVVKFISFLFVFKSYCAIVLYYSFWKGKSFSSQIWDSKYSN
jgi:hypothetical protein